MKYLYECTDCGAEIIHEQSIKTRPPSSRPCSCGGTAPRVWNSFYFTHDADPDRVPIEHAVSRGGKPVSAAKALRKERAYQKEIEKRRGQARGQRNVDGWKPSHSIPPELYYGKVRQTKDINYWRDPKNLKKHSSTKI